MNLQKKETPLTLLSERLIDGKADYKYKEVKEYLKNNKTSEFMYSIKEALLLRNDIGTKIFTLYIKLYIQRLYIFRNQCNILIKELNITEENNSRNEFNTLENENKYIQLIQKEGKEYYFYYIHNLFCGLQRENVLIHLTQSNKNEELLVIHINRLLAYIRIYNDIKTKIVDS